MNPQPLAMLKDTTKLKKHIALLCDRLSKGAKLVIEGQDNSEITPSFLYGSELARFTRYVFYSLVQQY